MELKADIRIYVLSVVIGILVGLSSVAFMAAMHFGQTVLWRNGIPGAGQGTWIIPVILTIAGLLMGLCVKYYGTNDGLGFEAVMASAKKDGGEIKFYQVPRVVLNALIGLIAGASIGPEAPLIALGGYAGSKLGNLLKLSKQQVQAVTMIAVGASIGTLLESPVAGPLAIAESDAKLEKSAYLRLIFSIMVATGVGYAIFLWLIGPVLTNLNMIPSYPTFNSVDMFYGFVVGIFAGAVGVAASRFVLKTVAWGKGLKMSPIIRGGLLGLALGIIGWVAPLVMFAGDKELPQVVTQATQFGVLVLLGLCLAKVVSLGLSFASGYQGGNIFPSFFIGGTLGLAINLLFPFIPVPVAMIACMAGIMFAMIPMPLFTMFVLVVISTARLLPVMALALAGAGLVILAANQIAPVTKPTAAPAT